MIRIEFIFSRFKSIPLGASGEGFRKQTKEGKSLFTLRGLVSCDANKASSELPLPRAVNLGIVLLTSRIPPKYFYQWWYIHFITFLACLGQKLSVLYMLVHKPV